MQEMLQGHEQQLMLDLGGRGPHDRTDAMEGDCIHCQARWHGNARFCSNCGSPIHRPNSNTPRSPTTAGHPLPGALPEVSTPRTFRMGDLPVAHPAMSPPHGGFMHPGYPPMGLHMDPARSPVSRIPPGGGLVVTGVPAGRDPWFSRYRWHEIGPGARGTTTYVVELRNDSSSTPPELYDNPACARIGCMFSWIPIVGFITYCVNYHAPEGSMQRRLARAAMATSIASLTFLILMQLFFTPQGGDQGPSQRTNP